MFSSDYTEEDFVNDYSNVKINVEDLQDLVKDRGYSLILKSDKIPSEFNYAVGEKIHIYDEDGLELNLGKRDKHGIPLSKVYVEFQNVLECRDLEIPYRGQWNKFDNLVSAKIGDSDINLDKIKVESNVDTAVIGEYTVKYSYEIYDGMQISNTAKVKVVKEETTEESSETETDSNVKLVF